MAFLLRVPRGVYVRVNEHGMSKKTSLTWMDRPRDSLAGSGDENTRGCAHQVVRVDREK